MPHRITAAWHHFTGTPGDRAVVTIITLGILPVFAAILAISWDLAEPPMILIAAITYAITCSFGPALAAWINRASIRP